ncbi:WhiB family transcriptional regulator [Streptoverticillium reticulum]|uniref:WhiB family transcriptional regulator n=1 Tax=Streptoverticillium reticulum TaxID=1433415 RepID=UPI0039BF30BA
MHAVPARPGPSWRPRGRLPRRRDVANAVGELTRARVQGWDPHWRRRSVCTHRQGDSLFFGHEALRQEEAVRICRRCPVTTECLAYALDERIAEGIFGGTTARWRGNLLARRPEVTSWRALLERARAEYCAEQPA